MPLFLLDTNSVSALMADHPKVVARARHAGPLLASVISRGEIVEGLTLLPLGKRRTNLELKATQVFGVLSWIRVTVSVAETYGRVKSMLVKQGLSIKINDLWIAATSLNMGAVAVSRDRHFRYVPGLQVEDWTT